MHIDEQTLQQITIDVCQAMLGLDLIPIPPNSNPTDQFVASVTITSRLSTFIVDVLGQDQLMGTIAEAMFGTERSGLSNVEIRDAFCEIANMIGGNVKGCLGEEADLSLPVIREANDWLGGLPSGSVMTTFDCSTFPLTIVLREGSRKSDELELVGAA